jgi:3-dehydroquinate synthase
MITATYNINGQRLKYYFEQSIKGIDSYGNRETTVIITDSNILKHYGSFLDGRKVIVLEPGEDAKSLESYQMICRKLVALGATKDYLLVGMGGGVVTDITGFVASTYMRGLKFAFIPTSLLAMVDAALGGKNGVNIDDHKNMIGVIRQPQFIIFDRTMLYTLPQEEWRNGFAEIIKYGLSLDRRLYDLLLQYSFEDFQDKHYLTSKLLYICTHLKTLLVEKDEHDNNQRQILNFGHTIGHAIEKTNNLTHGQAVAIGMVYAMRISEEINNFNSTEKEEAIQLIQKMGLPTNMEIDKEKVKQKIRLDKKADSEKISYIVLNKIGEASVLKIAPVQMNDLVDML